MSAAADTVRRKPGEGVPEPQNAYYTSTPGALRDAATALAEAGQALDAAARALRRIVQIEEQEQPGPSSAPPLRGAELRDAIVKVAGALYAPGQDFYYRDLYATVQAHGHRVGARDPLASFLTALSRAPEFEPVGGRSGRYRLLETARG